MRDWPLALHPSLRAAALLVSVAVFVLGIALVPVLVVRLPADYFVRREGDGKGGGEPPGFTPAQAAVRVVKNALGALLLLAGIAMLVLPGQGVLTILAALSLLDLPGKRRLERRLLSLPGLPKVIAAIRERAGRPPLQL